MSDPFTTEAARAAEILREVMIRVGVEPSGLADLLLEPCPVAAPPYGVRTGTWDEAVSFLRDWASEGRRWVNIGVRVRSGGGVYLCYEVPDRGTPDPPLASGRVPSTNINWPASG